MSDFQGLNASSFTIKGDENKNDIIFDCKMGFYAGSGKDGATPKEMIDAHHKGTVSVNLLVVGKPKEGFITCKLISNNPDNYFISR